MSKNKVKEQKTTKKKTQTKKQKKSKLTYVQKRRIASHTLLYIALSFFFLVIFFLFFSTIETIITFANLHNSGLPTEQVWAEIAKHWWSFVCIMPNKEETGINLGYSWLSITCMAVASVAIVITIPAMIIMNEDKIKKVKQPKQLAKAQKQRQKQKAKEAKIAVKEAKKAGK